MKDTNLLPGETRSGKGTSLAPRILTTKWVIRKEWANESENIYDYFPLLHNGKVPSILGRIIKDLYRLFDRFDFFIGVRLFINRKNFDAIISTNCNQALVYSILGMIFKRNRKLHFLNEIYLHEPVILKNKIRPFLYRHFFSNIDYMRVSSRNEILNYSDLLKTDKGRFWYNPWPSHISDPEIITSDKDYILSAGKQYRDYSALVKAIKGTGYKLIIISDKYSMKDIELCDEVSVLYNINKEEYFNLLLGSKFVIVPLSNDFCSCGQVAFLEAMSYGKPVIVTRVTGSIDYFENGISGIFYEKGNDEDLRQKIILLNENPELRESISREALNAVKNEFNFEAFKSRYSQIISDKLNIVNNS